MIGGWQSKLEELPKHSKSMQEARMKAQWIYPDNDSLQLWKVQKCYDELNRFAVVGELSRALISGITEHFFAFGICWTVTISPTGYS